MPHLATAVECLVCGKRTEATHMGMNACRACSIFYKRNHKKKLVCVNGSFTCLEYGRSIFWCRKCRLDRFESVLRAAWGGDSSKVAETPESHSPNRHPTPPLTPKVSILDKLRDNHQVLSKFRCAAELKLRGIEMNAETVNDENFPIAPCTYQFMEEGTRILIPGLINFSQATFPDFATLQNSDKWLLIRNYANIFVSIDAELRNLRRFGKRSSNIFGSYTTCMYLNYVEYFFSDCPHINSITSAAKTLHETLQVLIPEGKKAMHVVDPSEEEYFALLGLALWSVENIEASNELLEMAARYRTEIMTELSAHYRQTIGEEREASRMGTILCLLQECRRFVINLQSDYEIYSMLDVWDENTIMYRLPVD